MTDEIKGRIEQIQAGKTPDGYIKTKAGMMPIDWNVNKKANEIFKSYTDKKHGRDLKFLQQRRKKELCLAVKSTLILSVLMRELADTKKWMLGISSSVCGRFKAE